MAMLIFVVPVSANFGNRLMQTWSAHLIILPVTLQP